MGFTDIEAVDGLHYQSVKCSVYHTLDCVEDEPKCAPLLGMLQPMLPQKAQKKKDEFMKFEKALCLNLNHKADKFEPSKFIPQDNCTYSTSGTAPRLIGLVKVVLFAVSAF